MADQDQTDLDAMIAGAFGRSEGSPDTVSESAPQFRDSLDVTVAEASGHITATEAAQRGVELAELSESAATPAGDWMQVQEATSVAPTSTGAGRLRVTLCTPGWGGSGHCDAQVLEAAGRDRI